MCQKSPDRIIDSEALLAGAVVMGVVGIVLMVGGLVALLALLG